MLPCSLYLLLSCDFNTIPVNLHQSDSSQACYLPPARLEAIKINDRQIPTEKSSRKIQVEFVSHQCKALTLTYPRHTLPFSTPKITAPEFCLPVKYCYIALQGFAFSYNHLNMPQFPFLLGCHYSLLPCSLESPSVNKPLRAKFQLLHFGVKRRMIWTGAVSKWWGSHCGWVQAGSHLFLQEYSYSSQNIPQMSVTCTGGIYQLRQALPHFTGHTSSETLLSGPDLLFLLLFSGLQVMLASWCAWWKDFNEKALIWFFCPSLRTGSWTALTSTPVSGVWSIGAVQVSAETTQSWATAQGNISLFHFLLCSERGREVSFSNKQILLCSWSEGWTQSPY